MSALDAKGSGLCGVLGVIAGTIGFFVNRMWRFPDSSAPAAAISDFVAAQRAELVIGMFLSTAAVTLWLAFGAGLWSWLRTATERDRPQLAMFLAGVISFTTLSLAGFTAFMVLVYRDGDAYERLLYDVTFGLLAMSGAPTVLALMAYGDLIVRTRVLPRTTAVLAFVSAAAHLVLFASFVIRSGPLSLQGAGIIVIPATLFAWIAATSGALARRDPAVR